MEKVVDLIFARNTEEIEALIKSKEFDVNSYVLHERSALALASSCGYLDVMECLIKNGADINLNNDGDLGYTPLEEAARDGKLEAIELLLEKGAEIDKGNTIDSTALIGACVAADNDVVNLLLQKGSNINHTDDNGQTALHYLCRFAKQWGSSVITETVNGVTRELENPQFKKHTAVFETLLAEGADVNLEAGYGYSPLHLAAETDTHTFIQPLIDKGAEVNFQNSKGFSPLHAASDQGNIECCKVLIANGADVNVVDNDGFTPLLGAVSSQNTELVKLLLEKGATKDAEAKVAYGNVSIGDTAVSVAKKLENSEIVELLS